MAMAMPIPQPEPGAALSPKAIRATLLPEDLEDFDREYRVAMATATETLDLTPVLEMLAQWRHWGVSSSDPDRHRRLLDKMARIEAGERLPSTSWTDLKKQLRLD